MKKKRQVLCVFCQNVFYIIMKRFVDDFVVPGNGCAECISSVPLLCVTLVTWWCWRASILLNIVSSITSSWLHQYGTNKQLKTMSRCAWLIMLLCKFIFMFYLFTRKNVFFSELRIFFITQWLPKIGICTRRYTDTIDTARHVSFVRHFLFSISYQTLWI